ncbi:MAG: efflux RND transporter permease subunit, partial [Nitrososphaera sp.]|nr:efflux RND transporter permease subunit [Nitrososphaera sp.]
TDFIIAVNLISPDGRYDDVFLSNYAEINITEVLKRIPGVGQVIIYGEREYSMRVWLDPNKLASLGLTASDVVNAVREQNQQVAAGAIGQPPAPRGQQFQYTINTLGRLDEVSEFENIIVRTQPDGSVVRVKDVARVELGAEDYDSYVHLNGVSTANIGVLALPGAGGNDLNVAKQVRSEMERLSKRFPEGLEYEIIYDTTLFVKESIKEVIKTLFEAILLVFFVVYIFLQGWRATLIPAITIPVCLIGTFALINALGFSINLLTLFGLVLATGLVVDDAIVVVENVTRQIEEKGMKPRDAAREAMREVTGPIIATSLVLMAVFIPVAFIPDITGQFYRQFALTIACSIGISALNALTLSPALCAVFLRPETGKQGLLSRKFNQGFDWLKGFYENCVKDFTTRWRIVLAVFIVLLGVTYFIFRKVPTGFIPNEDQGYFVVNIQTPDGSSLERTTKAVNQVEKILLSTPGMADVLTFGGYSFVTSASDPNTASMFPILEPWSERKSKKLQIDAILADVREKFAGVSGAVVTAFNPPAIQGLGFAGGFQFELQDIGSVGLKTLQDVMNEMIDKGNGRPELTSLFSSFTADTPKLYIDLDRTKAKLLDISISDVFDTLQTYLGALYVNDFNKYGRVYRVFMQADEDARSSRDDINRLYVRTSGGQMVPLSTLVDVRSVVGPQTITHYNLYRSAEIDGQSASGFSSGQAIKAMEELAGKLLPDGMGYEWTGIAYQEIKAGNLAPFIFALALVFVFLFLAALYESWIMPFMIILAVPLALLGALGAQWLRGLDNDVYCQIGLVMLIGLASKNSILIVEFAKRRREEGASIIDAALEAARIRLRPILMTAFAFILGVLPLVIASGAGANSRHSLGTAVFGGMIVATLLSLLVVPIF